MIGKLKSGIDWDICIIGGGATGLGIAVDAASRGYQTILFEKYDFAKGTSSRSTKLVHGGVRYLQQGNIRLVFEALHERGIMMKNAPHLVRNQSFVIPNYEWWEHPFYGLGLKAYDWMAGKLGFGPSEFLSVEQTLALAPTLHPEGLRGSILYHDGQFDDARMAIHLAMTSSDHGGTLINYMGVNKFIREEDRITGIEVSDTITGEEYSIRAKVVINATGVFADEIIRMDDVEAEQAITPSQGIHLVFDKEFLSSGTAIMIPRTEDGRVLFAVPWHEKIIVGTTDTPMKESTIEPVALQEEIEFVMDHISDYFIKAPTHEDIRSVFCGLRPLVKGSQKTSSLSREHQITVSSSGLVSIIGGKWTTYRKMAEDALEAAITVARIPFVKSYTETLKIHGYEQDIDFADALYYYGSDKIHIGESIKEDHRLAEKIHPSFPYIKSQIRWAIKQEMCLTVEDFLARRTRMLFLDAKASCEAAPVVASMMAREMNKNKTWIDDQVKQFSLIAKNYLPFGKTNEY